KNIEVEKIFATLGLEEHLSPSRRNGMVSMVEKIRFYAAGKDK
ncbi:MAG: SufE family protein, partial [Alphaproteobacteria bacterium]|nr:SufE family protein [Alphaproteobacteria bacterium]